MIEDNSIKNKRISDSIKSSVWKELLDESGLQTTEKNLIKTIKELLINICKTDIYPKDFWELFSKSKRIAIMADIIAIDYKILFGIDTPYYPNTVLTLDDSTKPLGNPVQMNESYSLNTHLESEQLPHERSRFFITDQIEKVSDGNLSALRNLCLDLFKTKYKIRNFRGGSYYFLSDIRTFGQLYSKDKDLYKLAYKYYQAEKSLSDKKLKENEISNNDIPGSLKNLRTILEI